MFARVRPYFINKPSSDSVCIFIDYGIDPLRDLPSFFSDILHQMLVEIYLSIIKNELLGNMGIIILRSSTDDKL